jgi:DNA-binding transcriptional regulator YdaS (Cro superfamily)
MKHRRNVNAVHEAIRIAGTQTDLARMAGCAQQTISDIATGRRRVSAEIALRIAKATGVPAHKFRPDLFEAAQ